MTKPVSKQFFFPPGDFKKLHEEEQAAIAARSGRTNGRAWSGIALSGGGIRSASFCLGALQALAAEKILPKIDYISSVSGGGYTNGSIQWLLHTSAQTGSNPGDFPFGLDAELEIKPRQPQTELQYIRWHANYLLPGRFIDLFSAITVLMRTIVLSLGIWMPMLVLAFLAIQFVSSQPSLFCLANDLGISNPLPWQILKPSWMDQAANCSLRTQQNPFVYLPLWMDQPEHLALVYGMALWISYGFAGLLTGTFVLVGFVSITRFPQNLSPLFKAGALGIGVAGAIILAFGVPTALNVLSVDHPDLASIAAAAFTIALGLACLLPMFNLIGMLIFKSLYKNAEYALRRIVEVAGGLLLRSFIYCAGIGFIPVASFYLFQPGWISKIGGVVTASSGLIAAIVGHLAQSRQVSLGIVGQALTALASIIFLYGVLVTAYYLNSVLSDPNVGYEWKIRFAVVAAFALLLGCCSNSNSTGLHRFYRDRLMELFMPSPASVESGRSASSYGADRLSISELWNGGATGLNLFPIVNCNSILVDDPDPIISSRGGANFAITPLHIGSSAHGWESCSSYERKNREMTLATAVAASGAAANGNAGYGGTGVTRNRAVSLVLMLLNIRLGVWVRRPSNSTWLNFFKPTPFFPALWYGLFRRGYTSSSHYVEMSDGGHFENLGIYELVRRRTGIIIAFDGEADSATALPALVSLARRIEEDFGAKLDFGSELDQMMPFPSTSAKYPLNTNYAVSPCACGRITYLDDPHQQTLLIFIKATIFSGTPFWALGYRAQHPDYPNETTANQFYSPEQFDAYRELGLSCTKAALSKHKAEIDAILC